MKLFFKTIPKPLNILVLLSIVILATKIFYFNQLPEVFNGAYEVGIIVEGLLASIVASYIFYLIVVHFKETKDKKLIYPYILKWAKNVVGACDSQIKEISSATGIQMNLLSITQNQVDQAMNNLNPHAQAPLIIISPNKYANWLQYLCYNMNRSRSYISKIMSQIIYIDSKLVALVTAIEESTYFYIISQATHHQIRNTNMSFISNNFFEYCQKCINLKSYVDSNTN